MAADTGLDAGFLVGTEDVVLGAKALALPGAGIQVQNRAGLLGKVGISRKDPVLVSPGFDGVSIQNTPYGTTTDRCPQGVASPGRYVGEGLPTQRLLGFRDQFTSDCLDQRMVQRGKNPPCGPGLACLPAKSRPEPTGGATVALNTDVTGPVARPRRWTPAVGDVRAAPGSLVAVTGTKRSFARQSFLLAPRMSRETQGNSLAGDHAWETSFDESHCNDCQQHSHFSNPSNPKTIALFVKRSTKPPDHAELCSQEML